MTIKQFERFVNESLGVFKKGLIDRGSKGSRREAIEPPRKSTDAVCKELFDLPPPDGVTTFNPGNINVGRQVTVGNNADGIHYLHEAFNVPGAPEVIMCVNNGKSCFVGHVLFLEKIAMTYHGDVPRIRPQAITPACAPGQYIKLRCRCSAKVVAEIAN